MNNGELDLIFNEDQNPLPLHYSNLLEKQERFYILSIVSANSKQTFTEHL